MPWLEKRGERDVPLQKTSLSLFTGCAELNQLASLVQAPRFEQAPDHQAEIRAMGPAAGSPLGGVGVRLWTKVSNPNAFSLTLGTLKGTLYLQESQAADVDFPPGLTLAARGDPEPRPLL